MPIFFFLVQSSKSKSGKLGNFLFGATDAGAAKSNLSAGHSAQLLRSLRPLLPTGVELVIPTHILDKYLGRYVCSDDMTS